MGLHKSEANLAVARAENSAMLKEKNYEQNYGGFNPNSPESAVMFSLYSAAYLKNSILLADKVQKNLINTTHLRDRGVNQAGYWVLWAVSMPSILIEMGFLTNPTEEKFLSEEKNKASIADAIYRAFVSYYSQVTGNKVATSDVIASDNKNPESSDKSESNDYNNNNSSDNQPDKEVDDSKTTVDKSPANPDGIRFTVQFMAERGWRCINTYFISDGSQRALHFLMENTTGVLQPKEWMEKRNTLSQIILLFRKNLPLQV